jgi:uncharacterized protein YjbI with pentapeptide repeats
MNIIINSINYDDLIFYGKTYRNIEYKNCIFTDVNFNMCKFKNVIFNQCILTNVTFNSCKFHNIFIKNYSKITNVYYGKNTNIHNILDISSTITSNILMERVYNSIIDYFTKNI